MQQHYISVSLGARLLILTTAASAAVLCKLTVFDPATYFRATRRRNGYLLSQFSLFFFSGVHTVCTRDVQYRYVVLSGSQYHMRFTFFLSVAIFLCWPLVEKTSIRLWKPYFLASFSLWHGSLVPLPCVPVLRPFLCSIEDASFVQPVSCPRGWMSDK